MNLTSLRRVKYALGQTTSDQDHILTRLVGSASFQIVTYLRRRDQAGGDALQLKERTEYVDPRPGQRVIYPRAYPITEIESVYTDSLGRYDGDQSLVDSTSYLLDGEARSITFRTLPFIPDFGSVLPVVPRGVRVVYTGGLAEDPVVSIWAKGADAGGTMAVGNYVQGEESLSVGRITATQAGAGALSLECLSGPFLEDETLTEYEEWNFALQGGGGQAPTGASAVLGAATSLSLAETHPAVVEACEMHVRYLWKNRNDFENLIVSRDGENRVSRADLQKDYNFLPEIRALLEPYRNLLVI